MAIFQNEMDLNYRAFEPNFEATNVGKSISYDYALLCVVESNKYGLNG